MKLPVDIWLEIVKGQLAAGDSAVLACSKANIVWIEYRDRFWRPKEPISREDASRAMSAPAISRQEALAAFEELKEKEKQKSESFPIPVPGYVAGDPNAR